MANPLVEALSKRGAPADAAGSEPADDQAGEQDQFAEVMDRLTKIEAMLMQLVGQQAQPKEPMPVMTQVSPRP